MKPKNFRGRREQRHQDALERQEYRDSLTPEQQLDRISKRRGNSTKETERLKKIIDGA